MKEHFKIAELPTCKYFKLMVIMQISQLWQNRTPEFKFDKILEKCLYYKESTIFFKIKKQNKNKTMSHCLAGGQTVKENTSIKNSCGQFKYKMLQNMIPFGHS